MWKQILLNAAKHLVIRKSLHLNNIYVLSIINRNVQIQYFAYLFGEIEEDNITFANSKCAANTKSTNSCTVLKYTNKIIFLPRYAIKHFHSVSDIVLLFIIIFLKNFVPYYSSETS